MLKKILRNLTLFFAVFGPATITAISDNDAAGVATYSLVGAKFGYSILFVLLLVTFLLAITQEMGVRIAIVTGKGLGDLIRERFGIKLSVLTFTCLLIANMGTIIANLSAMKVTAEIFNLPVLPFVFFIVFMALVFVIKGNYRTNQNIFLLAGFLYVAYIISAIKARPDWGLALRSIVFPTNINLNLDFIFASIAVVGTTITPWGQFFVHSYILDKKLQGETHLKFAQIETFFGAFLTDFFSFFMITATAATLFVHNISLVSGEQAALAIKPFAGELASYLFAFGILNAGFMGMVIVSLTTAYAFSEFFGYEGSLDKPFYREKLFYGIFMLQLLIAAAIIFIPGISLFRIVFYTQSINGILLPGVFYFLLKITNNPSLMGKHTNPKWYNYLAVGGSVIIVTSSLVTIIGSFLGL